VLLFLFIEARRYRYYELWTYRVRIMETNFFTGLLSPPFLPHTGWAEQLRESLDNPHFTISLLEALGRRYRRTYAPIFMILALSWMGKVYLHPTPTQSLSEFMNRAAVGPISGWIMIVIGLVFNGLLVAVGLFTVGLQHSTGEVLEERSGLASLFNRFQQATWEVLETDIPILTRFDPRKQMVYIITDNFETVGEALIGELRRGVTLLKGTGMYKKEERGVLMCVLDARQVSKLKGIVQEKDEDAFVVIMPTHEVRGAGFRPLEA